jgi:hypothetical protein
MMRTAIFEETMRRSEKSLEESAQMLEELRQRQEKSFK